MRMSGEMSSTRRREPRPRGALRLKKGMAGGVSRGWLAQKSSLGVFFLLQYILAV